MLDLGCGVGDQAAELAGRGARAISMGVLDSWKSRLERTRILSSFCGPKFDHIRDHFLATLASADHRSLAQVYFCLGVS